MSIAIFLIVGVVVAAVGLALCALYDDEKKYPEEYYD